MKPVPSVILLVSIAASFLEGAKLTFREKAEKGTFSGAFGYAEGSVAAKSSPLRPLEFNRLPEDSALSFQRPKGSTFYLASKEAGLQAKLSAKSNGPHLREVEVPRGAVYLYYPIMFLYRLNGEVEKVIAALTEYKSAEAESVAEKRQGITFDFRVEKGKVVLYTSQISTETKFEAFEFDFSFLSNSEELDLETDLDLALMESQDAEEAELSEDQRSLLDFSMLGEDEEELDRQIKLEIAAQKENRISPSEEPKRLGSENSNSSGTQKGQSSDKMTPGSSQEEEEELFEDPVFENVTKKDGPKTMKVTFDRVEAVNVSCGAAERVPSDPFVPANHGRAFYHCEQTSKLVIEMDRVGRTLYVKLLKAAARPKSNAKLMI